MAKQLSEHPWVEWAKFVKDVESRNLPKNREAALAKQKFDECFGDDVGGLITATMHAQRCKDCVDAHNSVEMDVCGDARQP